jgi:hypothetical protein
MRPFNAKNVTVSFFFSLKKEKNMNNLGYEMHYYLRCGCINCIYLDDIATCWME